MSLYAQKHDNCPTCRCTEPLSTFLSEPHTVSVAEAAKAERLGKLIHKTGADMDALRALAEGR